MKKNRNLPSMRALVAFEATARLKSVTAAAAELHLTPSAVTKQIQAFEAELGSSAFVRIGGNMELTESARAIAEGLNEVFLDLHRVLESSRPHDRRRKLHILIPSGFGTLIISRLGDFKARHPNIELIVDSYAGVEGPEFYSSTADVAVILGKGSWSGRTSYCLTPKMHLIPLCVPNLLPGGQPLERVEDLANYPWIYHSVTPYLWEYWVEATGTLSFASPDRLSFNNGVSILQSCLAGIGIAMVTSCATIQPPQLASGELICAHTFHVLTPFSFYLTHKFEARENPDVEAFTNWLLTAVNAPAVNAQEPDSLG